MCVCVCMFFVFCSTRDWTKGLCLQVLCHLNHAFSPFLLSLFFRWLFFLHFLPGAGLGLWSSHLYFLSGWDYRCEPLAPSLNYYKFLLTIQSPITYNNGILTCIYSKSLAALQSISMESRAGSMYLHNQEHYKSSYDMASGTPGS
jgi:hypothetical protein